MKRIEVQLDNAFSEARTKGYDHIVIAVDLHNTIIDSIHYNKLIQQGDPITSAVEASMYNQAIKPLQLMSLRSDIQLMLFSGTKQSVLDEIVKHLFDKFGIKFLHVNDYFSNDPIPITNQNFTKKPYYSILWDDKAGFSFDYDWPDVEFFINDYSIIF